jgi:hypothetical protein
MLQKERRSRKQHRRRGGSANRWPPPIQSNRYLPSSAVRRKWNRSEAGAVKLTLEIEAVRRRTLLDVDAGWPTKTCDHTLEGRRGLKANMVSPVPDWRPTAPVASSPWLRARSTDA